MNRIKLSAQVSHVGISDHSLIYSFRKLTTGLFIKDHSNVTYRKFKNFNPANFRHDISSQSWEGIKAFDNSNLMWQVWKNTFIDVVDRPAPLCTRRVRISKSPWISAELKQRMRQRDILKIKAIQTQNLQDWSAFKQARNSVNNEIKIAKESYYKSAFNENEKNLKKTWSIINELTSRKQSNSFIKEVKLNNSPVIDSQEICEAFNNHFADIGPMLAEKIPINGNSSSYLDYLTYQNSEVRFHLSETNPFVVFSLLSKLCKSKATGLDKISAKLLQLCPDLIAESLCIIFNSSINTGIFPDEWKCSKVIPLFKQGERSDLTNYRPISVIPVVAKVFERIIYNQVYAFLVDTNVLSNNQSGFRCLHSTVTALLEATIISIMAM